MLRANSTAQGLAAVVGVASLAMMAAPANVRAATTQLDLENICHSKIQIALAYRDEQGRWGGHGFYSLKPGETRKNVATLRDKYFYVYGHVPKRKYRWEGNDFKTSVCGSWGCTKDVKGFRKRTIPDKGYGGVFRLGFGCKNLKR